MSSKVLTWTTKLDECIYQLDVTFSVYDKIFTDKRFENVLEKNIATN